MRLPRSRFSKGALVLLVTCSWSSRAVGQACCAGGSAVTPGRLGVLEEALVGAEIRAASVVGSYQLGSFRPSPSGTPEYDYEEDLFGALRVLGRGQLALLVPFDETYRRTPMDGAHFGGGVGDINFSGRYDFLLARESRYIPGVALLAGITLPTGKSDSGSALPSFGPLFGSATAPLAVDATGIGAFQANAALALEQTFGPWLANATAIVAKRTEAGGETLGTQFTFLVAGAYTFENDAALALSASYAFEGDGTIGGVDAPGSSKSLTVVTASGLWPLNGVCRLLGGVFVDPPVGALGSNQPTQVGLSFTAIRSWM
jgi:hypothetical protein